MLGLMQDSPLLISSLIGHAARYHPHVEIVSRTCEGPVVRTSWGDLAKRVAKLANALRQMGIKPGDRVASLAWNTHRHVELYFAVSGIGAVLNTVNPRLFPEQIDYIVNHAENRALFFDITFAGLVAGLRGKLTTVERFVALTDAEHLPADVVAEAYEDLLLPEADQIDWPVFDERTASSLCYTSGTTGNPKGVLYTHRSTILHSFMVCTVDGFRLSSADSVLLVVPLFHVNAWGIPYAAAMCGAKLVLPGPKLDGKSLFELAVAEGCTFSLGVPTVWLGFFQHIDDTPGLDVSGLRLERVVIGGSAAPRAIIERFRRDLGVFVIHAWGMSETSPVATVGNLLPKHRGLPEKEQVDVQVRQGRVVYGVELRIVDENRKPLPQDGSVAGDLHVRGPWVTSGYFKSVGGDTLDPDGWFPTGDVAKIDSDGYVVLTDRSKDVIKSGGEWISSIDLENAAVAHPAVQEAAVIGLPHPKWQERPLLIIVPKPGMTPTRDEILDFLSARVARWWLPDDVAFVSELLHTATGKLQKTKLREQFREYVLPSG
ncbi:MAG TPA: long-chain-fatty-acid--CoA ligase [Rhizobiales bacterium]|nr:long-chain-fatty-acid--CoA ligase [Hyphomicrobiales bacterium]